MTFLRSTIVFGFLLTLLACGDDPAVSDNEDPSSETPEDEGEDGDKPTGMKDGGRPPTTTKDSSTPKPTESRDSGTSNVKDAGPLQGGADAGKPGTGTGTVKDAGGGGIMFPDLFPPAKDAGTTPPTPGVGQPGAKDGPCKDLMLFCFDPIDMFLFNPSDCFTCNGGKGCQGCAIPYAF